MSAHAHKEEGRGKRTGHARQQPDPNFLIKHFEDLSARAALEEFTVRLKAPDRFPTTFRRAEIEWGIFGRVVCPGLRQRLNGVINLLR